jgi:hypothetical protein
MKRLVLSGVIFAVTVLAVPTFACNSSGSNERADPTISASDFQSTIDNPFFPLSSLTAKVFEGEEPDADTGEMFQTRLESAVLPDTDIVGGVEVTVLQEKDYENGDLVELTLDYFAQHRDGSVYYFGERVDTYEGGTVAGHEGQWLSGEDNNRPGIYMPGQLVLNQTFDQEHAPGIAEDQSRVVALDQAVTTPAGSFSGCVKTEDTSPLDNSLPESKFYCRGIGLVREEVTNGHLDLISY